MTFLQYWTVYWGVINKILFVRIQSYLLYKVAALNFQILSIGCFFVSKTNFLSSMIEYFYVTTYYYIISLQIFRNSSSIVKVPSEVTILS